MKPLYIKYYYLDGTKYHLSYSFHTNSVQHYMHISDVTPTEKRFIKYVGYFNDPDEEKLIDTILLDNFMDCYRFLACIQRNGIKYQLAIDLNGIIRDGNCRYWCAIELNIYYLPINLEFYLGTDMSFYPKKEVITA